MEEMKKDLMCIMDKTKELSMKIKEYDASKMTSHDFMESFDLMKDTAMTMAYLAKARYYDTVVEAMEAGNYVMTKEMYDVEPETWKKSGKHYYTDDFDMLEKSFEKYDEMRDMASLENMLNHLAKEITNRTSNMDVNQKNLVKTKMTTWVNAIH